MAQYIKATSRNINVDSHPAWVILNSIACFQGKTAKRNMMMDDITVNQIKN